jgi:hypothetical protein
MYASLYQMGVIMKLKKARAIVTNNQIIYPKNMTEIERKVKILNKRAVAHKDSKKANKLRNKAEEWEVLLRLNFWNVRNKNV